MIYFLKLESILQDFLDQDLDVQNNYGYINFMCEKNIM